MSAPNPDEDATDQSTFDERAGYAFPIPDQAFGAPPSIKENAPDANPQQVFDDPGYMAAYKELDNANQGVMAEQKSTNREMLKFLGEESKNRPPIPQLEKAPQAPQQQLGQGLQEYMGIATVLGALGGAFSRGNATVALTAFSGAIQGFTEGNKQVFDAKMDEWKAASERVKEDNQARLEQYNLIWNDRQATINEKLSAFKIVSAEYQDEITHNLAVQKDYMQLAQFHERTKQLLDRYDASHNGINGVRQKIDGHYDEGYEKQVQFMVDYFKKNGKFPATGYSKANAQLKQDAIERLQEEQEASGMTPEQFQQSIVDNSVGISANRAEATTGARRAATLAKNVENASNEVRQLLPQALETSQAFPRGKFVPLNTIKQMIASGTSNEQYNDFLQANLALAKAYGRAMNPQGLPRVAETKEREAIGSLSQVTSSQAYEVQLRRIWKEVLASREATRQTLKGEASSDVFPGDEPGAERMPPGGSKTDPLGLGL